MRRTRLVASHLHPPVVVSKTPAGPLRDTIVVRIAIPIIVRDVPFGAGIAGRHAADMILAVARNTGGDQPSTLQVRVWVHANFALDSQLIHRRAKLDTIKVLKVNRYLELPGLGLLAR